MSSRIENYLGFPSGVSGDDLARRAVTQAKRFGTEILAQEVMGLRCDGPSRIVTLADGGIMECRALLIATGVSYRKLDVPGADTFTGAGVYYGAAMTEALSCRDEEVYVGRRSEFRRTSCGLLCQVCQAGHHAGARVVACAEHVAIFDRSDWGNPEYCR